MARFIFTNDNSELFCPKCAEKVDGYGDIKYRVDFERINKSTFKCKDCGFILKYTFLHSIKEFILLCPIFYINSIKPYFKEIYTNLVYIIENIGLLCINLFLILFSPILMLLRIIFIPFLIIKLLYNVNKYLKENINEI